MEEGVGSNRAAGKSLRQRPECAGGKGGEEGGSIEQLLKSPFFF